MNEPVSKPGGNAGLTDRDPVQLFGQWFREAAGAGIVEPGTMTLATADAEGRPSARIVLLKDFDEKGFVFYTNYLSRKGTQLEQNPRAALVIHWQQLGRQVRIEGRVEKTSAGESDRYFSTRPRGSRLGAWASRQSSTIPSRESLEKAMREKEREYGDLEVPRPPQWGGYRLVPDCIEFWVGREDRLHDRVVYERTTPPEPGGTTGVAPVEEGSDHNDGNLPEPRGGTGRGQTGNGWKWRRLAP